MDLTPDRSSIMGLIKSSQSKPTQDRVGLRLLWIVLTFLPFLTTGQVAAQSYLTSTGTPSFSAPEPVELGFADTANGNLHLTIPLGSYPQRGTDQPEQVNLIYDSNIWSYSYVGGQTIWQPSNAGGGGWRLSQQILASLLPTGAQQNCTDDVYWSDRNGTTHVFHMATNPYTTGCATSASAFASDSSGFWMAMTTPNAGTYAVYAPDGTLVYSAPPAQDASGHYVLTKDTNGNYLARDPGSANFYDTLGRTIVSGALSGYPVSGPYTVTTSQGTSQYQITGANITLNTKFSLSGVTECVSPFCTTGVIRSITLPDQAHSTYYFTYDCDSSTGNAACGSPAGQTYYYGELVGVTLQTGGTIAYTYTMFKDAYGNNTRWLNSRITAGGTWTYTPLVLTTCSSTSVGCQQQTTVQNSTGSSTVYTFTLDNGAWPVSVVSKDTSGSTLSTVKNTWDFGQPCVLINCHGHSFIRLLTQQTVVPTPGGNLTKQVQYTYDTIQHGNITATKEWRYIPGTTFSTTPDRATYVSYLTTGTNDINRPITTTLCNNVGSDTVNCPGGGSRVSQTTITYDAYGSSGLTSIKTLGISQHDDTNFDTSYTTRGNATTISQWVSATASNLTTSYTYDTSGQVLTAKDNQGNVLNYSYADKYYTDPGNNVALTSYTFTPAKPTNAYRTSVTDAVGTQSVAYYYGSGTPATLTDYNGAITIKHYQDGLDRKTEDIFPIGWDVMNYPTSSEFDAYDTISDTSQTSSCTNCQHTQVLFDSWGRKSSEILANNPSGQVNVDYAYDAIGRIQTVSHPYSGSSDPNHVFETHTYDGLARTVAVTHPDGQAVQTAYGANVTGLGGGTSQQSVAYGYGYPLISQDETAKQKQQWIDGFGRIIEVDEPSPLSGATGSVSINTGPGGQSQPFDPCQAGGHGTCPQTAWNSGTITVTVDGYSSSASYGLIGSPGPPPDYSTPQTVATALAAGFSSSAPFTVSAGSSGIQITAKTPGASGDFSFTTSATWYNSSCPPVNPCFGAPALSPYPASGSLSGGGGGITSSPYFTNYSYDAADNLIRVVQGVQTRTFAYDGLGRKTQEITPEGGTVTLSYTTSGGALCSGDSSKVCQRTDARGVTTAYTYDSLGRLTGAAYTIPQNSGVAAMPNVCTAVPNGTQANVCYYYDQGGSTASALGRLTKMTDSTGSETYSYDVGGRITQRVKVVGTTNYTTAYQYNLADEVTKVTYPSGRTVSQAYNAIGQLCAIAATASTCTPANPYASGYSYDGAGRVTGFTYGNSVSASYTFPPPRNQLTNLSYKKGSQTYFSLAYWYQKDTTNCPNGTATNNGQIQCITDSVDTGRTANYGYDPIGRLISAGTNGSTAYPKWGISDSYDRFGNRWSQTGTAGTVPTSSLTFGSSGMNSSTNNRPTGYTYDASGNLTVEPLTPTNNLTYDGENQMVSFSGGGGTATYNYDGNGMRVKKAVASGTTTVSIFSGSSVIAEYDNGASPASPSREYIYSNSKLLAMISGTTTTYYHADELSARLTSDGATGNIVTQQGHFPFGEKWYQTGTANSWFFTAYDRDSESGLDYALARYYNSRTGTFCSADPLAGSPGDPQSWNRYPYGRNDPIDITDPRGQDWFFSFVKWFVDIATILVNAPAGFALTAADEGATEAVPIILIPPPETIPSEGQAAPAQPTPQTKHASPIYCNPGVMDAMKTAYETAQMENIKNKNQGVSDPKKQVEGGFPVYQNGENTSVGKIGYGPAAGWDPQGGATGAAAVFHTHPNGNGEPSSPGSTVGEGSGDTGYAINDQVDNYVISWGGLSVAKATGPLKPPKKGWDPWIIKGNGPGDWLKKLKAKCGAM